MLENLHVMKVDAKQELDNMNSPKEIEYFKKSILIPDGVNIDGLLDGDRYFLTGEKGAGKTALLIYSALRAEDLFKAEKAFIIFKEFSQEEREDYTELAYVTKYDQAEIGPYLDYEYVWWWLFHSTIADSIKSSNKEIFIPDENLDTYLAAIDSIKTHPRNSGRKMPIITKDGYVEAAIDVPIGGAHVKLSGKINFEKNPNGEKEIRFSTHINEIHRLYCSLEAGSSQLYIVVDELNLSRKNAEEYNRDIIMIRDMIIAIERFNAISKNAHDNVRIIGSIRNEVINSVKVKGKEINKSIESYSIPIDWTVYEEENLRHPLIMLLINYFRISDTLNGEVPHSNDEEEFYKWVDREIYGFPSETFIRNNTLYRPRHVVRLLNLSKTMCGNQKKISSKTFSKIRRRYSLECWNEITEELALSYTVEELELIKEWLTGMPWRTTYTAMHDKAVHLWKDKASHLLEKYEDIIRDLYYFGVIGNYIKYPDYIAHRWYFRGDETLLKEKPIQIHRIFSPVLSTVKPEIIP